MRKRVLLPIVIGLSVLFNIAFVIGLSVAKEPMYQPFVDLGPAVIQDSYNIRAPGLESPFGMIGDIPGGYPLYLGNPLQSEGWENISISPESVQWIYGNPALDTNSLVMACAFAVIPLTILLILGRRSYGISKTQ